MQGFYVAVGGRNNKKCIGSTFYQMIEKWVINVLEKETMSFSVLLSVQTNIIGFVLLTHSLARSLTHSFFLFGQSVTNHWSQLDARRPQSKRDSFSSLKVKGELEGNELRKT